MKQKRVETRGRKRRFGGFESAVVAFRVPQFMKERLANSGVESDRLFKYVCEGMLRDKLLKESELARVN